MISRVQGADFSSPPAAPVALAMIAPDMAPNVGATIRLAACLGAPIHIVEPCGFPFGPRAWRRQAMDYAAMAEIAHHRGWQAFLTATAGARLIALSARAAVPIWHHAFAPGDILLLGSETAGLAPEVQAAAAARVAIPLVPGARSLNVAQAAAIALAEAQRQTQKLPNDPLYVE
ncbi:MAG: TrmH family RNA methyltransferase [Pseudomonadota bacterium]